MWNLQHAGGARVICNAYAWIYRLSGKAFAAARIINRWPRCTGQKAPEPTSTTGVLPSSWPFLLAASRNLTSARQPSIQLISDCFTSGGVGGLLVGVERDSELPIVQLYTINEWCAVERQVLWMICLLVFYPFCRFHRSVGSRYCCYDICTPSMLFRCFVLYWKQTPQCM